jgi:hypothetical protein
MKVCPQYNRGKCSITENDIHDGTLVCPKHRVPLVDLDERAVEHDTEKPEEPQEATDNPLDSSKASLGKRRFILSSCAERSADAGSRGRVAAHPLDSASTGLRPSAQNDKSELIGASLELPEANEAGSEYVCPRNASHRREGRSEKGKCWCGATLVRGEKSVRFVIDCEGQSFPCYENHAQIGRGEQSCFSEDLRMLLLGKPGVSCQHLEIQLADSVGRVKLREPRKTTNGTSVEDTPILQSFVEFDLPVCVNLGNPGSLGVRIEVRNG